MKIMSPFTNTHVIQSNIQNKYIFLYAFFASIKSPQPKCLSFKKYIKTSYKQPLQIKPFNTKRHAVFALYDENIIQNRFGKKVNK